VGILSKNYFVRCFARSNLYSAKEKLEIVSVCGGATQFCPATPEPRALRGEEMQFELFLKYTANLQLEHTCNISTLLLYNTIN
jgi:hypothetical protein